MKVLGLDISKNSLGWALGDASGPPTVGSEKFWGRTHGAVGWNFQKWFRNFLILHEPDVISGEATFVHRSNDPYTHKMMLGLEMVAQTTAAMRGIQYEPVAVASWRKAFLGLGNPSDPKAAAQAMCARLGWGVGDAHDEAEACGVWCWGHLYHGDKQQMRRLLSRMSVRSMGQ